jgi:hypothetical protein
VYGLPVGLVVAVADVVFTVSSTSGDEEVVFTFEVVVTVSKMVIAIISVLCFRNVAGVFGLAMFFTPSVFSNIYLLLQLPF